MQAILFLLRSVEHSIIARVGVATLFLALSAAAPAVEPNAASPVAADDQFIVHEWGTFTSYSGSDGGKLEFRSLVENDLPPFVQNFIQWSGNNIFSKAVFRSRQRMETPVTYFYTDRVRDVRVQVGFPAGVLTEFYPPVKRLEPTSATPNITLGLLPQNLRNGLLDWGRVTLIPHTALRPGGLPDDAADAVARRAFESLPPGGDPEPELYNGDHYYYARETDSALVHVRRTVDERPRGENGDPMWPFQPVGDYFEKFLFYRGLGNFELPLTVESLDNDRVGLLNRGAEPLAGLLLVQVRDGEIRFRTLKDLAVGESRIENEASVDDNIDGRDARSALFATMQHILVDAGLYEKEAVAMTRTWESSWFTEEGTRLLYLLPRPLTDEILPLTIEPAPRETVRVMVGRMELLPRRTEQRLLEAVSTSAAARGEYCAKQIQANEAAAVAVAEGRTPEPFQQLEPDLPAEFESLGRFAEPALRRIAEIATEADVRDEAFHLLARLQVSEP